MYFSIPSSPDPSISPSLLLTKVWTKQEKTVDDSHKKLNRFKFDESGWEFDSKWEQEPELSLTLTLAITFFLFCLVAPDILEGSLWWMELMVNVWSWWCSGLVVNLLNLGQTRVGAIAEYTAH